MWHKDGAQISDTVRNLLITHGIIDGKKINVLPKKSPPKKEEEAPKATAPAVAPVEETPVAEPDVVPETPEEAVAEKASA